MSAVLINESGTWIATFIPITVLVALGALIGSLWTRRRDRER